MGIREDYTKARELAKAGKFAEAKTLLEPYKDHSKVRPMYDKIVKLIPSRKLADKSAKPAKKKSHRVRNLILFLVFAIVVVLGSLYAYSQFTVSDFALEFEWISMCRDIARDGLVESDVDFDDAIIDAYWDECERQGESVINQDREAVAECYWDSNRGDSETVFQDCLADNDVFIDPDALAEVVIDAINSD